MLSELLILIFVKTKAMSILEKHELLYMKEMLFIQRDIIFILFDAQKNIL